MSAAKFVKIDGIKACVLWATYKNAGRYGCTFETIQSKVGKSPVIQGIAELMEAGMMQNALSDKGEPVLTKYVTTDHGIRQLRRSFSVAITAIDDLLSRVQSVGHPKVEVDRLEAQRKMVEEARSELQPFVEAGQDDKAEEPSEPVVKLSKTVTIPPEDMPRGPKPPEPLTEKLMGGRGSRPTKRASSEPVANQ